MFFFVPWWLIIILRINMCYAIPARLVEIKDNIGYADYFGERRKVLLNLVDARVGDYVYAQGGLVVNTIPPDEAKEILEMWREAFFSLKKVDEDLSKVEISNPAENKLSDTAVSDSVKPSPIVLQILQKVNLNKSLTNEELQSILNANNSEELKLIYAMSNNIRQRELSNACCVHGIIEFSNYCKNNCLYCGIRNDRKIERYRMEIEEIIEIARNAVKKLEFRALVLQSGEDDWYDEEKLITVVREISKLGVLVILSIGDRDKKTYQRLYESGARGVLLRFETSNEKIFHKMRRHSNLHERLEIIRYLKEFGYIVATGFIIGLPDETDEDILNNIRLTMSLKPDMYSFGPLIPTKETPLEDNKRISKDMALKITTLSRFLDRQATILVTTALETLAPEARREGLLAGANSLMINITPNKYKGLYSIYDNRAHTDIDVTRNIKETIDLLHELGRAPIDLGI